MLKIILKYNLNIDIIKIIEKYNRTTYTDFLRRTDILHFKLIDLWVNDYSNVPVLFEYSPRCEYLGKDELNDFSYFLAGLDFYSSDIEPTNRKYKIVLNIYKLLTFDTNTELFCLGLDMRDKINY